VDANVSLEGAGAATTVVDGTESGTVVTVDRSYTVGVSGLTIENGNGSYPDAGGILDQYGTLTATNDTFLDNSATSNAGGIYSLESDVTATNDTFSGNSASYMGGTIFNNDGNLIANDDTLSGNSAEIGGGVYQGSAETGTLANTVLANNSGGNCSGTITDNGYISLDKYARTVLRSRSR
jgi:hypothetical protein